MAKSKRSKRSRRSSSYSSSRSSSDSDSSSSLSDSISSNILDTIPMSGRLAKWIVKGIPEKHMKAAREAFKPSVEKPTNKKCDASNLFTNPRLDESLYAALKSVKNSLALLVANIDPQGQSTPIHQILGAGKSPIF